MNNFDKKYQTSKNNWTCLGPCNKPSTLVLHPITLEYITDKKNNFCPVLPWFKDDDPSRFFLYDECHKVDNFNDSNNHNMFMNIITPKINFESSQFLKIYYNIFSFENAINWIEDNSHKPIYTKLRILECVWKTFGNNYDILNDRLINIYFIIIKKYWINIIYNKLQKYIFIDDNNSIFFVNKDDNNNNNNNNIQEQINFIMNKLVNKNNIYKILSNHIDNYIDEWDSIINHHPVILQSYITYLENKIIKSI